MHYADRSLALCKKIKRICQPPKVAVIILVIMIKNIVLAMLILFRQSSVYNLMRRADVTFKIKLVQFSAVCFTCYSTFRSVVLSASLMEPIPLCLFFPHICPVLNAIRSPHHIILPALRHFSSLKVALYCGEALRRHHIDLLCQASGDTKQTEVRHWM